MLAKRMMLMFFSDKTYVAGALWNIVIVLFLFVAFLGENMAFNMQMLVYRETGMELYGIDHLSVALVFGGLTGIMSVSTTLGSLQILVDDRNRAARDFHISPISRAKISRGYMLGSTGIGIFLTSAALIICVGYMMVLGGSFPDFLHLAKMLLAVILSVVCANAFIYLTIVCFKKPETYYAFSGVLSTLIGFMMGVYVPFGILPNTLQWLVKLFPLTHSASMFRQVLTDTELAVVFADVPEEAVTEFRSIFAIGFDFGPFVSDFWISAAYLAVSSVVFYVLSVLIVRRKVNHDE